MILLKPLTTGDANHFYALYQNPGVNHNQEPFLPGESPLDFTKRIIEACVEIYTIRLITDEERIIGDCALHDADTQHSEIEIGGSLLPAFQGKGLMQEAFSLLEKRAREVHKMQCLVAKTEDRNNPAIMLMKKLGYSKRSEENGIITFNKLRHD